MGVAKLKLAANITPTTKGRGSTPRASATPITTGVNSTATALLLMNSVAIDVAKITSDNTTQGEASPARGFYLTWDPLTIDQVDTVLQDVLSFADLHQHLMWVCFDSPAAMEAVGGE